MLSFIVILRNRVGYHLKDTLRRVKCRVYYHLRNRAGYHLIDSLRGAEHRVYYH